MQKDLEPSRFKNVIENANPKLAMNREWKPGCPEWTTENGSPTAEEKRLSVLEKLVNEDYTKPPSIELVTSWHKEMFEGIAPHRDYLGKFRNLQHTSYCLQDYDVIVGDILGTDCSLVLSEVETFFSEFNSKLNNLERSYSYKDRRPPTIDEVSSAIILAAWAHGEWIRIHPFANGNGRTARLLANFILIRFGFGPALAIRPRPDQPYGIAARESMMNGNHQPMEEVIWRLLAESYSETG